MTISIEAKPYEVEAEIKGYGVFRVRRLGAGAEADLKQRLDDATRAVDEVRTAYQNLYDRESKLIENKDADGLATLRQTDEYKQARADMAEAQKQTTEALKYAQKAHLKLWSTDNEENWKKLLNDFSYKEILGFYQQIMAKADNA